MKDNKIEGRIVFTNIHSITFPYDYDSSKEMWTDIGLVISVLLKTGYEVKVTEEEAGVTILEYCYNPLTGYESPRFVAISEEEEEYLGGMYEDN